MSTTEKALQEVLEDAHHQLLCAIEHRPYNPPGERAKVATLAEALRRSESIRAVGADRPALLDDGLHARLVRAIQR
jgi:hypothetical protein